MKMKSNKILEKIEMKKLKKRNVQNNILQI